MPLTKEQMTEKNEPLHDVLEGVVGQPPVWTKDVYGNRFAWLHLARPSELKTVAEKLAGRVRLCTITAYAEERDDTDKRRRIAYHFADGNIVVTVTVPIYDPESLQKLPVPSITPWFRNADWNEREFREMFNIDIEGHPNPKRLFLDERLDAGIMTKLIPFSAMANSAGTNTLWERILEAKGIPPEERLPSLAVPAEPIKLEPSFTPVSPPQPIEPSLATPTLVNLAKSAEEASRALGRKPQPATPAAAPAAKPESTAAATQTVAKDATDAPKAGPAESGIHAGPSASEENKEAKAPPVPAAAAPAVDTAGKDGESAVQRAEAVSPAKQEEAPAAGAKTEPAEEPTGGAETPHPAGPEVAVVAVAAVTLAEPMPDAAETEAPEAGAGEESGKTLLPKAEAVAEKTAPPKKAVIKAVSPVIKLKPATQGKGKPGLKKKGRK